MQIKFGPLTFIMASTLVACGEQTPLADVTRCAASQTLPIVQGRATGPREFAETGALLSEVGGLCSGTLIAPDVVLTAAHCVSDAEGSAVFVPHHRPYPLGLAQAHRVYKAVPHPDYHSRFGIGEPLYMRLDEPQDQVEQQAVFEVRRVCGGAPTAFRMRAWMNCLLGLPSRLQRDLGLYDEQTQANDIALLFLDVPVAYKPVASLPSMPVEMPARHLVTAVGYGVHDATGLFGLRAARRHMGKMLLDQAGPYEAQMLASTSMVRKGDSGGPVYSGDGEKRQVWGVLSRGRFDIEGRPEDFAIFTRVDAYLPWIHQMLEAQENGGISVKPKL